MAKRKESRSRARPSRDEDLSAYLPLRVSSQARAMLEERAQKAGMPPAILHRRVLYRFLGLITDDKET